MKNIGFILFLTAVLTSSCVNEPIKSVSTEGRITFELKTKDAIEVQTRSNAHENEMNDVYLIVFDNTTETFVECKPATAAGSGTYAVPLTPRASAVKVVAVANIKSLMETKMSSWVAGSTTYATVWNDLLTDKLTDNNGSAIAMPQTPPLCFELLLNKIEEATHIASPFVMERATAKITISVADPDFTLLGANLRHVPTRGYVMPKQTTEQLLAIARTNYIGPDGNGGYGADHMICAATTTDPLYAYETPLHTDPAQHPFVIVRSDKGYYRINLTLEGKQISLQRNYYYKINIKKVLSNGAATADEAANNPPLNADIVINDPDSHEIISNGIDYLGLTNSEYIFYDSYALNEFDNDGYHNLYGWGKYENINGFDVATLTYQSRSEAKISVAECQTESGTGAIRFQNAPKGVWDTKSSYEEMCMWGNITNDLTLPASPDRATSKKIIINIPYDFQQGKLKVEVGTLVREISIQRHNIISHMGDVINMGSGFSTAKIDFEEEFSPMTYNPYNNVPYGYFVPEVNRAGKANAIGFAASANGNYSKTLLLNPSDELHVKINPLGGSTEAMYAYYPMYDGVASEFYLTRHADQSRVRVHLIQEPFMDGIKDTHGVGGVSENYSAAFWKNNQAGERIIRVPRAYDFYNWTARVIYGADFIRLAYTDDSRTTELGETTSGNAEDYRPDQTWKTYLQMPYSTSKYPHPKFRIGLTGTNPNPQKPRYGLVAFMVPYSKGSGFGQTFLIFVRQGEEPDYLFEPSDTYNGSPRTFAQAFSPYNLTVSDPQNHPGGPNFSDHKQMTQPAVFTQFPTQQGYLYQWGSNIAIHPDNPEPKVPINGYTYDYNAAYQNICPSGYAPARTDASNSTYFHSLVDPIVEREISGLCADGYYDRRSNKSSDLSYPVGSGPDRGSGGYVYYNTKTRASLFIPKASNRQVIPNSTYDIAMSWANIEGQQGELQGTLRAGPNYSVATTNLFNRDRAISMRCVKIAP